MLGLTEGLVLGSWLIDGCSLATTVGASDGVAVGTVVGNLLGATVGIIDIEGLHDGY